MTKIFEARSTTGAALLEIEAKMKVDDLDAVRSRLQVCGAEPKGQVMETNRFFDTEDRSMLAADEALRVRSARDLPDGDEFHTITHKGPRRHGKLQTRVETQVGVSEAETSYQLLEQLGFVPVLTFEKRRESWMIDDCSVELDEMPRLGTYIEIEGPNEQAVLNLRDKLELQNQPLLKASYVALLMAHLQESADTDRDITFEPEAVGQSPSR